MAKSNNLILVSACLVGLCTRYDGKINPSQECLQRLTGNWIPVCPEQLGGLPTPREAADIIGGNGTDVLAGRCRIITKNGEDVTTFFVRGAEQVLNIAKSQNIQHAFLKSGSPSCGAGKVFGVTSALLHENGITVEEF